MFRSPRLAATESTLDRRLPWHWRNGPDRLRAGMAGLAQGFPGIAALREGAPEILPCHRIPAALLLAMAASSLCFVCVGMHLAVELLAGASYDDGLFLRHAESIAGGHWLGAYGVTTLAKGPGYPLFLALNALTGLPVTLTQALLDSGACGLLALTLFRVTGRPWTCLLGFLLMQWHPAMFPTRIVRDDLSAPQVLLLLACLGHCLFLPTRLWNRLLWAAAAGIVLAWFWMTREDAVWVLPGVATICLLQGLRLRRAGRRLARLALVLAVFGGAAAATLLLVCAVNFAVYRSFELVDFKDPHFAGALDRLQSVRAGPVVPYVPVPLATRRRLDAVSPAFASLEPYLEGGGRFWTQFGCSAYPDTCGDYAGGWFMWAFREAVASLGDYRSPAAAAAFYDRLSAEVKDACDAHLLDCRKSPLPFMPAMRPEQWRRLPAELRQIYGLATWQAGQPDWLLYERSLLTSSGSDAAIAGMQRFLGNPLAAPGLDQGAMVAGWFTGPGHLWLQLRCSGPGGVAIVPVAREPSPDVVRAFHQPAWDQQRFAIALPGQAVCGLQPSPAAAGGVFGLTGASLGSAGFAGGRLSIDKLNPGAPESAPSAAFRLLAGLSHFYGRIIPAGSLLAFLAYGFSLLRAGRRRRLEPTLILLTGILVLLLARAGILILVDISSFPAIVPAYWAAGYPLLSLFIVLSLASPFARRAA